MSIEYTTPEYSINADEQSKTDTNPDFEPENSMNQFDDEKTASKKRKHFDVDPQTDDFLDELEEFDEQTDFNNVFPSDSDQNINTIDSGDTHQEVDPICFQTPTIEGSNDLECLSVKPNCSGSKILYQKQPITKAVSPSASTKLRSQQSDSVNYQSLQHSFSKLRRNYDIFDTMVKNQIDRMFDFQSQIRSEREEVDRQMKMLSNQLKVKLKPKININLKKSYI
jgi:hypothetical protein